MTTAVATRPTPARASGTVTRLLPAGGRDDWDREVRNYVQALENRRRSPRTITGYQSTLRSFASFMADDRRDLTPARITRQDVRDYQSHLIAQSAAPATQMARFVGLNAFFRFLSDPDEQVIKANPMAGMKAPQMPQDVPTPILSAADTQKLLKACDGRTFEDRRDAAIILLMLSTGLRRDEVAGILIEDCVFDARRITVKTGKGERTREAEYGSDASEAIRKYLRLRDQHPRRREIVTRGRADHARTGHPLFIPVAGHRGGITGDAIQKMLARRCRMAGIAHVHPHQLRHTWAHVEKKSGTAEEDLMYRGGWRNRKSVERYGAAGRAERALANFRDPLAQFLRE
jgi:site-specific recombinase XerD